MIKKYIPAKPRNKKLIVPVDGTLVSVKQEIKQRIDTEKEYTDSIKEKVDEVTERVNNSRVGVANLLRNTGFLGDFNNLNVDYLTALANNTPIDTNSLAHWTHSDTVIIDAPSRSGKGIKTGSIQQNVKLKAGEPYVLSFWAKGTSVIAGLVDTIQIPLTSEYKRYSFDIVAGETKEYTFILIDNSNTAEVYEIMLSNGNTKASYAYAEEDDVKAISQLQAINTITSAIKEGNTQILGGLILSTMIQLGKYKNGVMEKVTSGMNGIWNSDEDPAIWAGGTFDQAISTVQKFKDNPSYQPTEEEWAEMAKMVLTHGGDGFFRGYIYALGGIFRGKVETSVNGNRISIDPSTKDIRFINNENEEVLKISFITDKTASIRFNEYYPSGNFKKIVSYSNNIGYEVQEYDEIGGQATPIRYGVDGAITNRKLIDMTDEVADATLVSGQWYRTGRIIKVKP